jgi:hypothetical protein
MAGAHQASLVIPFRFYLCRVRAPASPFPYPVHAPYPSFMRSRRRRRILVAAPLLAAGASRRRWSFICPLYSCSTSRSSLTRVALCTGTPSPDRITPHGAPSTVIFKLPPPTSISLTATSPPPFSSPGFSLRGEHHFPPVSPPSLGP